MMVSLISVELYLSPVETYCENINYFIPDEENLTKSFSEERMARLREYLPTAYIAGQSAM